MSGVVAEVSYLSLGTALTISFDAESSRTLLVSGSRWLVEHKLRFVVEWISIFNQKFHIQLKECLLHLHFTIMIYFHYSLFNVEEIVLLKKSVIEKFVLFIVNWSEVSEVTNIPDHS